MSYLHFFPEVFLSDHPFSKITPTADESLIPAIYMLGSSNGGMQFAVEKGLGFVFAAHIAPHLAVPMLRAYRENFKPSSYMSAPKSILSTIVITAETDEEAEYLAGPVELFWARLVTGKMELPIATLEEASSHVYSPAEARARRENKTRFVIGSVEKVAAKLRSLATEAMVDEIMMMDFYTETVDRHNGYRLLAEEFGLSSN